MGNKKISQRSWQDKVSRNKPTADFYGSPNPEVNSCGTEKRGKRSLNCCIFLLQKCVNQKAKSTAEHQSLLLLSSLLCEHLDEPLHTAHDLKLYTKSNKKTFTKQNVHSQQCALPKWYLSKFKKRFK